MEAITTNAMSSSLLARNVYCVCFTARDSMDIFHGEFAEARKKFFTGNGKTVRVGQREIVKGFDGKLQGKLTRRSFYWKKTAHKSVPSGNKKVALEESFDHKGGTMLVLRDFRGIITGRMFFDRSQIWLKSEYYEPRDYSNARVIFKPCDTFDAVERFDYDREKKRYRSTLLYPVPYLPGSAEQSLLNARFGEPQLILSTGEGDFCYCPEQEADSRKNALKDIGNGSILLIPAWEVKDGSLTGESQEEPESEIAFTSLEEYARIRPPEETAAAAAPEAELLQDETAQLRAAAAREHSPEPENPKSNCTEKAEPDASEILEAAHSFAAQKPQQSEKSSESEHVRLPEAPEDREILDAAHKAAESKDNAGKMESEKFAAALKEAERTAAVPVTEEEYLEADSEGAPLSAESGAGYCGSILDGRISGRGRTEQPNGLTAYDGDYMDGKRHGFGSYYYKDGALCYAGFWKDDRKDGVGVSFRNSDHALHVAPWEEGRPGKFASLFDRSGSLRYAGRIENGKKQGVGISYNGEDGSVFVGKWMDGVPTGYGTAFDREGNLLYTGMWKDGKRCGSGTEFDENGEIVFSGEWKDGKYHNGILYKKLTKDELSEASGQAPGQS